MANKKSSQAPLGTITTDAYTTSWAPGTAGSTLTISGTSSSGYSGAVSSGAWVSPNQVITVSPQVDLEYPSPQTIQGKKIVEWDYDAAADVYEVLDEDFNTYRLHRGAYEVQANGDITQKQAPPQIVEMGMTPEGKVKKEIKQILKDAGAYFFMPVQNGMGAPSLDFLCVHRGYSLAIEAKAPGKKPTPRQETTIAQMQAAGCKVFVIDGTDYSELILWLESRNPSGSPQSDAW